jgi:TetR/AcrR family transcriptional regulator, cholesterol catabolism regulator
MGALYTYIADKDALLGMILDAVGDAVERVLAPPESGEEHDPRQRLRGLIRRHVLLTEAMQPWFAFAFMEVKAFNREARDRAIAQELRTERLIAQAIEAGVATGAFRTVDATMTAALVKPMLQDWYVKRWKHRRRGTTPETYAEALLRFVEGAVAA